MKGVFVDEMLDEIWRYEAIFFVDCDGRGFSDESKVD